MTEDNKITDSENLDLTLKYDEGMYQYIRLYKRVVELKRSEERRVGKEC